MDFVPKTPKKTEGAKAAQRVETEADMMLKVAPERAGATEDFETSVASAARQEKTEDLQVRVATRRRIMRARRAAPEVGQPATEAKRPISEMRRPATGVRRATTTQQPATEVAQPITEVKRPISEMRTKRVATAPKRTRPAAATTRPTTAPTRPAAGKMRAETGPMTGTGVRRVQKEVALEEVLLNDALDETLNDPLERPISEFADLEQLAQEIEEVTRGNEIIEEETEVVSGGFNLREEPRFGVVEDYQPRFINTEVEKRPLSGAYEGASEAELTSAQATGVAGAAAGAGMTAQESLAQAKKAKVKANLRTARRGMRGAASVSGVANGVGVASMSGVAGRAGAAGAATATEAAARTTGVNSDINAAANRAKMQIPQAHFINQNKVTKRPLSKTMYAGRTEAAAPAKADEPVKVVKNKKKGGTVGMVLAIIGTIFLGAAAGTVAFLLLPR